MPNDTIPCEIRLIHPDAAIPRRGEPTDVGYDVQSVEAAHIRPGETVQIRTGIELSVPEGWYWTIEGRSRLNKRRVFVVRPIMDATYTGEAEVYLRNDGHGPYEVEVGDRVAQIVIGKVYDIGFNVVEKFSPEYSKRGNRGYGSTGR